jgi:hypothetical protein
MKPAILPYTGSIIVVQEGGSTMRFVGTMLLLIGMGSAALATVPEISPASAGSALALISGAVLVMRGRRTK